MASMNGHKPTNDVCEERDDGTFAWVPMAACEAEWNERLTSGVRTWDVIPHGQTQPIGKWVLTPNGKRFISAK